jgi:hypothetical protein
MSTIAILILFSGFILIAWWGMKKGNVRKP